jgi:hypothetical protein
MTHISGHDRSQILLLPEAVDDYVGPDNPVRFIDGFVDGLDLAGGPIVPEVHRGARAKRSVPHEFGEAERSPSRLSGENSSRSPMSPTAARGLPLVYDYTP